MISAILTLVQIVHEEVKTMSKINESIECSVHQCKFHNGKQNYCTLNTIHVGTHELNPTEDKCTDCQSFQCK